MCIVPNKLNEASLNDPVELELNDGDGNHEGDDDNCFAGLPNSGGYSRAKWSCLLAARCSSMQ